MRRDTTLDSLRGLLLIVMTIDHLAIAFHNYTIHTLGFITAAEGFIFLSGFVAGIVYSNIHEQKEESALWGAALKRVRSIYLSHMFVFSLVLVLGIFSNVLVSSWQAEMPYFFTKPLLFSAPWQAFGLGAALLYQPAYLDILPLYCVFLLLTPFLLKQFANGHALRVLIFSIIIWLCAQFGALELLNEKLSIAIPVKLGFFNILAWQMLYTFGLYAGFCRYQMIERQETFKVHPGLFIAATVIAIILCLMRHELLFVDMSYLTILTAKDHLGFLRIINFAAISYIVMGAYTQIGKLLKWNWIRSLGQHSLQVYAFHVILLFLLAPLLPQLRSLPLPIAAIISLATVMSLSIPVWFHQRYREVKKGLRLQHA